MSRKKSIEQFYGPNYTGKGNNPGVVFSMGFCYNWNIGKGDFMDYMERPEAFSKEIHQMDAEYNVTSDYMTYMENDEKSDGLFDSRSDCLSLSDIQRYRRMEEKARDEGAPKYIGVLSFNNDFLREQGVLMENQLDMLRIKKTARQAIAAMVNTSNKLEGNNVFWTAAIHTNTDNIHVHFSICEKECRHRQKDMLEVRAFDALKSAVVNKMVGPESIKELTSMQRDVLLPLFQRKSGAVREQLAELMKELPDNRSLWQYNRRELAPVRNRINKCVSGIISDDSDLHEAYSSYVATLDEHTAKLKEWYGDGNRHLYLDFKMNRLRDTYERLGNALLKNLSRLHLSGQEEDLYDYPDDAIPQEYWEHSAPAENPPDYPDDAVMQEYWEHFVPAENPPDYPDDAVMQEYWEHSAPAEDPPDYPDDAVPQEYWEHSALAEDLPDYPDDAIPQEYWEHSAPAEDPPDYPDDAVMQEYWEHFVPAEDPPDYPDDAVPQEYWEHFDVPEQQAKHYLKWSKEYKKACKLIYDKHSKRDDFQKAEHLLLSESKLGNVLAIHDLGKLYSTEKLGEIDLEKSQKYYSESLKGFLELEPASKLKSYVQYRIGKMYCYGLGTDQDYTEAFKWFEKSAVEENKYAQFSLANLYYYGKGVEKDLSQAFLWYQKSASQEQPYASYAIAQMYNKGECVSQNEEVSQRYYKDALSGFLALENKEQADDNLFCKVGMMYKNGLGTDIDVSKAIEYFKRSAGMNNKNGLYEYGKALLLGEYVPQDLDKAEKYLESSAGQDNEHAQYTLGKLLYSKGRIKEGLEWLHRSADLHGNQFAQYTLAKHYLSEEQHDKAEKYLESSAGQDNEHAQYTLGKLLYSKGRIKEGLEWLHRSADLHGNQFAQYTLGKLLYFQGHIKEGLEWLHRSADLHGNQFAQYTLAKHYLSEEQHDKAEKYLESSAKQGFKPAKQLLKNASPGRNSSFSAVSASAGAAAAATLLSSERIVSELNYAISRTAREGAAHCRQLLAEYYSDIDYKQSIQNTVYR